MNIVLLLIILENVLGTDCNFSCPMMYTYFWHASTSSAFVWCGRLIELAGRGFWHENEPLPLRTRCLLLPSQAAARSSGNEWTLYYILHFSQLLLWIATFKSRLEHMKRDVGENRSCYRSFGSEGFCDEAICWVVEEWKGQTIPLPLCSGEQDAWRISAPLRHPAWARVARSRGLKEPELGRSPVKRLSHLMVYSRVPSSFSRSSLFGVVMLCAMDFFPLRKKVSGVQMLLASRLFKGSISIGPLKQRRSSFQLWRKNTSIVYSCRISH